MPKKAVPKPAESVEKRVQPPSTYDFAGAAMERNNSLGGDVMFGSLMVRLVRGIALTLVIGLLVPLLAAPIASAEKRSPATAIGASSKRATANRVPHLRWRPCRRGFECATARVPLDYDRRSGSKIRLRLVRLPARDPDHKIGSIFLNPGGPGGSGVDFVRAAGPFLFSDKVRARFDLVGFDPRGIIRSTPLRCFGSLREAISAWATPFPFPVTPKQERIWVRGDRRVARACARKGGAILKHMSTANVARDMNFLRRAVGDKRLTYSGYSYGSYLGATYANLFPTKVRALAVDAVLDPIAWATGRRGEGSRVPFAARLRSAQGAWATLRQFFYLCNQGGDACAFSGGDPRRRYDRLADRLLAEPALLPNDQGGVDRLTYADLVSLSLSAMYDPFSWVRFAKFLQGLDELTRPHAVAVALEKLRNRFRARPAGDYPNFVEGFPGVACSDTDNPAHVGAWKRAAEESDTRFPYFGRPWTWLSSICQPWPGKDADRYTGPWTKRTSNPVLVVGNRFDPATPYHGAQTLDRLLPRSSLLTLEGWGHTSLFKSLCVDAHVSRYLLSTRVPPDGTVCEPDVVPFAQGGEAQTGGEAPARTVTIPPLIRRSIGE